MEPALLAPTRALLFFWLSQLGCFCIKNKKSLSPKQSSFRMGDQAYSPYRYVNEQPDNPNSPMYPTKSVFEKPMELFRRMDFWPLYKGMCLDGSNTKNVNAMVRTALLVLFILSFYSPFARIALVCTFFYFVIAEVVYKMKEDAMSPGARAVQHMDSFRQLTQGVPTVAEQRRICQRTGECLPLMNTSMVWGPDNLVQQSSGAVAPALYNPVSNPYGNPLLFDYDNAVRSEPNNSVLREYGDSIFDRMWIAPEQLSDGRFFATVPDTTLMAATRGVPMPSLVGDVRALP